MRRFSLFVLTALLLTLVFVLPALASSPPTFPEVISLTNGISPEGIAVGRGHDFYTGSLATGAIYRGDLRTGDGDFIHTPQQPAMAVGMAVDERSNLLFVAGGLFGTAYVYDAGTGEPQATYVLDATGPNFINDVIVTRDAAYFTNSFQPVLYRLPLGPGGHLPGPGPDGSEAIALNNFPMPGPFNANGIEATPDGQTLIVMHSALGKLFRVDPLSGDYAEIDLGTDTLPSGDGIVLDDTTLYVVQNFLNQIGVVYLNDDLTAGTVDSTPITHPEFKIPTTAAAFGDGIYAVNARFDVNPPGDPNNDPNLPFDVIRVDKVSDAS